MPAQPLAMLGAMTQGMLGSIIARAIDLLRGRGTAAALVTHVTVDPADPAFGAPSKPIGPFFEPAEAERLARPRRLGGAAGFRPRLPPGGGLAAAGRRDRDRGDARAGQGRLPGHRRGRRRDPVLAAGPCRVVDAVIDKDRAACLIARQLGAQALLLVTAVDRVMLDYGMPTQSSLGTISAGQAAKYLAEGQFPPGSMGPKIEAALRFLDEGGELAVVTSPALLAATLAGHGEAAGTRIERAASQSGQAR